MSLFNLYINGLATGIKDLHKGVDFGNTQVSILLSANDIVLIADDEQSLQDKLNYLYEWCNKWRLSINNCKTNVHFRPKCVNRIPFEFKNGNVIIETTDHYKHLGHILDEFVTFESCATVLSQSGNWALGALRNKIRNFKDCRYQTFTNYITHVWQLYLIMVLVFGDITDLARLRQFRTGLCATSWEFIVLRQTMQFRVMWGGPYVRLAEN